MRSKAKKKKNKGTLIIALIFILIILCVIIFLGAMMKNLSKPSEPGIVIANGQTKGVTEEERENAEPKESIMSKPFTTIIEALQEPMREPYLDKTWAEIGGEEALNEFNGQGYYETFPGVPIIACTGYVSWAMTHVYGIEDYPHDVSSERNRNAGEYVDAHRMWLMENAEFVGSATTVNGVVEYQGGRYKPGDIIVFNNQSNGSEGTLHQSVSNPSVDYWGEDGEAFFTHIAIVGDTTTLWDQDLENKTVEDTGEQLPAGQYNMHHDSSSLHGVSNILSPEQFITRDVPPDNMVYSRSYEVYRVLR